MSYKINSLGHVANPIDDLDIANKQYVDNTLGLWDYVIIKTADQTINNQSIETDTELLQELEANALYMFESHVLFSSPNLADFQHTYQYGTGTEFSSAKWGGLSAVTNTDFGTLLSFATDSTKELVKTVGYVETTDVDTLDYIWGQSSPITQDTTVYKGSMLLINKILDL